MPMRRLPPPRSVEELDACFAVEYAKAQRAPKLSQPLILATPLSGEAPNHDVVLSLNWLERQGTRAIAAIVFIAIVLPPLDALLKPS